jgi:hypothetical protein
MGLVPVLAVLALATAFLVGVLALVRATARGPHLEDRHGLAYRWVGLAAGALAGMTVLVLDGPRHLLGFAVAPLVGAGWLAGVLAGERTRWRARPAPPVVSVSLEPRVARRYVSARSMWMMRACYAGVLAMFAAALATASPSSPTMLEAVCSPWTSATAGPWPGGPYAVTGMMATAALWLASELAVRYVVHRPATFDEGHDDERVRVLAARTAATAAVLGAVPNLGVASVTMGGALQHACPTRLQSYLALGLVAVGMVLSLGAAAAWLLALFSGGRALVTPVATPRAR